METKNVYTVPWFSSEEWLAVYEDAFKNNEDLNKAYDQMCVWKSRCGKLPVAIEATFPLLRGLLAQQDAHLHESFKHSLITSSIARFVSILHQAYMEKPDMRSKIMYGMDNSINLPPFLNKIRNMLVHEDEIMGAKETLGTALEAAVQWIKFYYWDDEAAKILQCHDTQSEKKPERKVERSAKEAKPPPLELSQWQDCAIAYRTQTLKYKLKKQTEETRKVKAIFFRTLHYMSKTYPDYCARTFFQIFFCSTEMNFNPSQLKGNKKCKMCKHTYTLDRKFLKYTSYSMKFLDMNIFIKEVLRNAQSHPKICFDWFQMLINTVEHKKSCQKHLFHLKATPLKRNIDWKAAIFQLLSLCSKWSLTIGLRILSLNWVHLKPKAKTMISQLVKTYHHDPGQQTPIFDCKEESARPLSKEGGTLQDLVKTAVINSPQLPLRMLSSACQKVNSDVEVKAEFGHAYCLGILPHQVGDPHFFKKLIIQPENSVSTVKTISANGTF